jgi:hypothetical protein
MGDISLSDLIPDGASPPEYFDFRAEATQLQVRV